MSDRASPACTAAAMGLMAAFCSAVLAGGAPAGGAPAAEVAPAADIRDIRGPKGILPFWLVPALVAGGALLAVGGYAAWHWARRPRRVPRPLRSFEIALQRLEEVRRLLNPGSVREFSIAISDIVRQYIEAAFKITATHRTTEEFLHDLLDSSNATLAAHRNLLAEFLHQCDMAKFAGAGLSTQIMESLHQSARSFVIQSSEPPHDPLPAT
jgi:hypothetical protein